MPPPESHSEHSSAEFHLPSLTGIAVPVFHLVSLPNLSFSSLLLIFLISEFICLILFSSLFGDVQTEIFNFLPPKLDHSLVFPVSVNGTF